ncbi:hypothetical protein N8T08_004658 [Aspergillus melleus]|uniref:Uncharacterized protein n=1 Tax=Aspergillus melleus TaxID=138277 RepID=A0ACC3B421_9EURO|nr:hypothetical protein N8T08_004658 [Aspergillus melleus]
MPSTKPFKYVDVCQTQSSASLCDLKVGKLRVDCCFLMSKMRWGKLRGRDSGLMYLDLTFHQPADCKLAQATITMNFHDAGSDFRRHVRIGASDLEVTEFFGPQTLSGEKRERQVSKTIEASPKIGAANASFEGIGLSRNSEVNYASRWKFTGTRFAADMSDDTCSRSSRYRQLVWHLEENELERQAVHHSIVHTALAFHHDSKPFYLDLQIEVKMQRWHQRFRQRLICPPRNRKAITRAKIEPVDTRSADPLFPSVARNLNQALIEENLHPVVEVSDPKPAILPDEIQEGDNELESDSRYLPNEALLALARQLTGQEAPDALTAPRRRVVMSTERDDSSSSSSTLVESGSSNERDDRTGLKADVLPEAGHPLSSVPKAEVAKVKTTREGGQDAMRSLVRQTSQLLTALIASLILGLTGVHSALARAGDVNSIR